MENGVQITATDSCSWRKLTAETNADEYAESSLAAFQMLYQTASLGQFIAEHCAAAIDYAMATDTVDDAQQDDFESVIRASIAAVQALGIAECVYWRSKIQKAEQFLAGR